MNARGLCTRVVDAPGIAILDLEGEIDVYTATPFREAVLRAIDEGSSCLVVDAIKVSFMDSTGLGVLILGERRLRPRGGTLALACTARLRRLLEITGLQEVFSLHESRAAALQATRCARTAVAATAAAVGRQADHR